MLVFTLHIFAVLSLLTGLVCACAIAVSLARQPLPMHVMNVVWPIAALFGSVWVFVFFRRHARHDSLSKVVSISKGCLHCGSGCALGDLCSEGLIGFAPSIAVLTGWHWLFADRMWATWTFDTILAFGFGIAFQYFAIAPMRQLQIREGLKAAVKADAASLAAWQVGMFGVMAIAQCWAFPALLGHRAMITDALFWWAMQLAMLGGFVTSFPVNAWLLHAKIKEPM